MGKIPYTTEQFEKAIPNSAGIVSEIAKRVGCDWHTARKFIDNHARLLRMYQDESEKILDVGEAALFKAVQGGDMAGIKYLLSTKGKHRGYVERQELTGADGDPLIPISAVTVHKAAEGDGE